MESIRLTFHLYHCENDYKYVLPYYQCLICDYCSGVYCDCQIRICSLVCSAPSDTVTDYKQDCPYFKEKETANIFKCCAPHDYKTKCPFNKFQRRANYHE